MTDLFLALTAGLAFIGIANMARTDRAEKALCINGHQLVGDNLIVKRAGKSMIRNCRQCTNARKRVVSA